MRVFGIGDIAIDVIFECDNWPDLGSKAIVREVKKSLGGMVSNVMINLAVLGQESYIVDDLNLDDQNFVDENLKKSGVKMDHLRFSPDVPTTKALVMVCGSERTIFVSRVKGKTVHRDFSIIKDKIDCFYSTINDIRPQFQNIISENAFLVLDIEATNFSSIQRDKYIIDRANVIFINQFGLEKLEKEINIDTLLNKDEKIIVITRGKDGCTVLQKNQIVHIEGLEAEVVDTTGAGDTFNSVFLHAFLTGETIKTAGHIANIFAAKSTEYYGFKAVSKDEYEKKICEVRGEFIDLFGRNA